MYLFSKLWQATGLAIACSALLLIFSTMTSNTTGQAQSCQWQWQNGRWVQVCQPTVVSSYSYPAIQYRTVSNAVPVIQVPEVVSLPVAPATPPAPAEAASPADEVADQAEKDVADDAKKPDKTPPEVAKSPSPVKSGGSSGGSSVAVATVPTQTYGAYSVPVVSSSYSYSSSGSRAYQSASYGSNGSSYTTYSYAAPVVSYAASGCGCGCPDCICSSSTTQSVYAVAAPVMVATDTLPPIMARGPIRGFFGRLFRVRGY